MNRPSTARRSFRSFLVLLCGLLPAAAIVPAAPDEGPEQETVVAEEPKKADPKKITYGFSGSGGGQLPGYEEGARDQYRLRQYLFETAWQGHGFSWQQEFHWKEIDDTLTSSSRRLRGGYAQLGYFFSELWSAFPEPLEIAVRHTRVDPDRSKPEDTQTDSAIAVNWFFNGHRNKLTTTWASIRLETEDGAVQDRRLSLQWDVSF